MLVDLRSTSTNEFNGRFLGPFALLKKAWKLYISRFKTLVGIYFLPTFSLIFLNLALALVYSLVSSPFKLPIDIVFGVMELIYLLTVFIWAPLALIHALSHADAKVGFRESFGETRSKIWPFIWLTIIQTAISLGLSLLFIVPALIFSVWTMFTSYILINENIGSMSALLKSREYVRGHWWGIVGRFLVFEIFLIAVIFIPTFILTLILAFAKLSPSILGYLFNFITLSLYPLIFAWMYEMYRNLRELKGNFEFVPSKGTKTWWIIFGVLGAILLPLIFIGSMLLIAINPSKQIAKASDVARQNDLKIIESALIRYQIKNDKLPTSLTEIDLPQPLDPKTKQPYTYQLLDSGSYRLCAQLESSQQEYCLAPTVAVSTLVPSPPFPTIKSPIVSKTPSQVPVKNPFVSSGMQSLENGLSAIITSVKPMGKNLEITIIFTNTSTSPQIANPIRVSMYSPIHGTGGSPGYMSVPLSAGQSRQFNINYEMLPEPPPYIWKYAKMIGDTSVTLGTYSPN